MRGYSSERRVRHSLEIAEHRIAEDLLAGADGTARWGAFLGPGRREVHERAWRYDGQLAHENLIVDRKDCCVDAQAERKRGNDHDGEQRPAREAAQAEAHVVQQVPHYSFPRLP
jgi:hypothetical protein